MNPAPPRAEWYRQHDLDAARNNAPPDEPAAHQKDALTSLNRWYQQPESGPRGGVLVLPTGGGKTYTAVHFLCRGPLSEPESCKLLWLAHTHHLLEQAAETFGRLVGLIHQPRQSLNLRVVSGTPGHCPVHTIQPTDDVVISTLQTVRHALGNNRDFESFLKAAGDRLFVVFDEAHHSPAPSYRRMLEALRERYPRMRLLGLTATPTHTTEGQRGWFSRLFPQGILHQTRATELIASGVLARPVFEDTRTDVVVEFDEERYSEWSRTNRDLPDEIVTALAQNRERNERIVNHYAANRDHYGSTIMFADRWPQCVALCELLNQRGVRAGAVFSHRDAALANAEARNYRREDENRKNLRRFRAHELDVLVNIRMLTEGTDIPDAQTVFLTRQTTSQILLTQMIGRALRGPLFGGTERAYIVSFIDEWKHLINWAEFDQFRDGPADDRETKYGDRLPIQWVSIELVRRLARQMDSGENINTMKSTSFLPVGWYHVSYTVAVTDTDDDNEVNRLVMVFEREEAGYQQLLARLSSSPPGAFENLEVTVDQVREQLEAWNQEFFDSGEAGIGDRLRNIFSLARHVAHSSSSPRLFPFDAREQHNVDALARQHLDRDLGPRAVDAALRTEYHQPGRFWPALFHTFERFRSHYQDRVNRLTDTERLGAPAAQRVVVHTPEAAPRRELDEGTRAAVFQRDGMRCLCCRFEGNARQLRLDHIAPFYHGGQTEIDNSQTLCIACNTAKGEEQRISFRTAAHRIDAPNEFPDLQVLSTFDARDFNQWEQFVRRFVNLFYRCVAVRTVDLASRGDRLRRWTISLHPGNDPAFLRPHIPALVTFIRNRRTAADVQSAPDQIEVTGSGA